MDYQRPLVAGVVGSPTAASWQRNSQKATVPQRRLRGSPDARFGSDPAVPSRRDLRGLRPHRARHWTVDAVSSNGGLLAPKSCHLRGRATAKTAHKPSLFPRRASDVQGVTDFLPCRWNPLQCWVLGVQGASAGTDVFLLAEHASETSPKTITFLLKPAPLLGSSVQQA